jgi:hypothetical protein
MPAGRPTKYTPDMCDRVVELGKTGASKHEMALELGIDMDTFVEWEKKNTEFSVSARRAVQLAQGWWEKQGRVATFGGVDGFNATSYGFNMKNRFRDSWKDKQETEHSGTLSLDDNRKAVVERILDRLKK